MRSCSTPLRRSCCLSLPCWVRRHSVETTHGTELPGHLALCHTNMRPCKQTEYQCLPASWTFSCLWLCRCGVTLKCIRGGAVASGSVPNKELPRAGAYMPVVLAHWGKNSGTPGGRSLAYVLGNMLSAGGAPLAYLGVYECLHAE